MLLLRLLIPAIIFPLLCVARQPDPTAFTVHDGLPSNNVYSSFEDQYGFLWVATDAGVARFDGHKFQVFTTRQGLPDNDVLEVIGDSDGRIWVNCFKQRPAYFDEVRNRFINAGDDPELAKVPEGTKMMTVHRLVDGSVMYLNEGGSFVFRHGKLFPYPMLFPRINFVASFVEDGSTIRYGSRIVKAGLKYKATFTLYHTAGMQVIDSTAFHILLTKLPSPYVKPYSDGRNFYLFLLEEKKCFVFSEFRTRPLRYRVDSIPIQEAFFNSGMGRDIFYFVGLSGTVYIYDRHRLRLIKKFKPAYLTNTAFLSPGGNLWINAYGAGLLLYRKQNFSFSRPPAGLRQSAYMSISRKPNGAILAGNAYGQVAEMTSATSRLHLVNTINGEEHRIRKIIVSSGKVFTFSEKGIFVNFKRQAINDRNPGWVSAKTAIALDDSTIIYSLISGIMRLNTRTEHGEILYPKSKRATSLCKGPGPMIYFGSTDGLYKCNYLTGAITALNKTHPLLATRVTGICTTPGNLVWVTTAGEGLIVLRNDKVILQVTEKNGILSNSPQSICRAGKQEVWLGSVNGISRVSYQQTGNRIRYSVANLSSSDGLPDNSVNDMLFANDTVFAATGNGLAAIPATVRVPTFHIPVRAVRVSVNQRDTIIASQYTLRYDQQFIQLQFAAIELNGHFRNLQYRIDDRPDWTDLPENTLTVQLGSGEHELQVRAIDVNGNAGQALHIGFLIATPFWLAIWFWLLVAGGVQVVVVLLISKEQKKRKQQKLARELAGVQIASLEQQAFTSLLNPHFLFNALNSIQHYMNRQDRKSTNRYLSDFASLIRKNFEAAQQSFISLEEELENVRLYLSLEEMRFGDRFSYEIHVAAEIDPDDWMVPTMLLQPLLENALLHGIMPSTIPGVVQVAVKRDAKNLVITITDNGIGIANSLAAKHDRSHKSRGMELIAKRIQALSHFGDIPMYMTMHPVTNDATNPGNQTLLVIPESLHSSWSAAQKPR